GARGTAFVRRVAGGAAFAGAEGLLRAASRGRPTAIQTTLSIRRASAGSRDHTRALWGNREALSGDGAVSGIYDGTAERPGEGTVTRFVTKLSHCRHRISDEQAVLHMSAFLIVVLGGLALLVAYHTG